MAILVIDLGTTTIRAAIVESDGAVTSTEARRVPPSRPSTGLAEFDAEVVASVARELATASMGTRDDIVAVGITTQRASTLLYDAASSTVLGPGLGWQDQRTVGQCIALQRDGIRLAPNQSATKLAYLIDNFGKGEDRDLRFFTLDSWLAWRLSDESCHVTDATNAAVTGLVDSGAAGWDPTRCLRLGVTASMLPRIADSAEIVGHATQLPGAPAIAAIVGDQQASLIGQGCLEEGMAKITFGSGGMLDACVGTIRPAFEIRGKSGTFPIVTRRLEGEKQWGLEAILLSAGSCVEWLRDGLGIIKDADESGALADSVRDAAGVSFVPAFGGLGTPVWDFGARGVLVGLDASTGRAEIVRAVLEGIANAGADLLESVESDSGTTIGELRVDGGMAKNRTFLQLLANATQRPILKSSVLDATTRGAGFLAGVATGLWSSLEETASLIAPAEVIEPTRRLDRGRWREARELARNQVPFLSSLSF